jgi:hypothetical protein
MTRTSEPPAAQGAAGVGTADAPDNPPFAPRADGDWIELFFWPGRDGLGEFSLVLEGQGSYWRCLVERRAGQHRLVVEHATAVAVGAREVRPGLVVPNWPEPAAGAVDARRAMGFATASAALTALRCFRRAPYALIRAVAAADRAGVWPEAAADPALALAVVPTGGRRPGYRAELPVAGWQRIAEAAEGTAGGAALAGAIRAGLALGHDGERDDPEARRVALELSAGELAGVCAALARLVADGAGAGAPYATEDRR